MNKMSSFLAIAFFISAGVNAAETPKMHQQAVMAHEMMNNSDAPAHQQMAQAHAAQANNSFAHEVQAEQHRAQISTQG